MGPGPRTYFEMNTPHSCRADRTPCAVQENDSTWSVVASGRPRCGADLRARRTGGRLPGFHDRRPGGDGSRTAYARGARGGGGPELLNTHFNAWSHWTCREGRNRFEAFDFESARWLQLHIRNFTGKVTVSGVGLRRRIFPWPHDPAIRIGDPAIQRVMDATVNTLNNSAQDLIVDGMGRERQQYSGRLRPPAARRYGDLRRNPLATPLPDHLFAGTQFRGLFPRLLAGLRPPRPRDAEATRSF